MNGELAASEKGRAWRRLAARVRRGTTYERAQAELPALERHYARRRLAARVRSWAARVRVAQGAPLCEVCGHTHYQGVKCTVCGHLGLYDSVRDGPCRPAPPGSMATCGCGPQWWGPETPTPSASVAQPSGAAGDGGQEGGGGPSGGAGGSPILVVSCTGTASNATSAAGVSGCDARANSGSAAANRSSGPATVSRDESGLTDESGLSTPPRADTVLAQGPGRPRDKAPPPRAQRRLFAEPSAADPPPSPAADPPPPLSPRQRSGPLSLTSAPPDLSGGSGDGVPTMLSMPAWSAIISRAALAGHEAADTGAPKTRCQEPGSSRPAGPTEGCGAR